MRVSILDLGVGNIGSVANMVKKVGGSVSITQSVQQVEQAHKLIMPGVGSFDRAMERIHEMEVRDAILHRAVSGKHTLGICLGMQILMDSSQEGELEGLGIISGSVMRFSNQALRVPHMGWNTISCERNIPLLDGVSEDFRFYFVHSYYAVPKNQDAVLCTTTYGERFASGIRKGSTFGVQFHPEKSHRYGMKLIENFLRM